MRLSGWSVYSPAGRAAGAGVRGTSTGGAGGPGSAGLASRRSASSCATRWASAASTSRRTIRPPGPEPSRSVTSRPASAASRRASGLAKRRGWPLPAGATVATIGSGAGAGACPLPPLTPSAARAASTSSTASSGRASRAIAVPTSTSVPSGTRVRRMTPSDSASTSTTALSVSTVAMTSAFANRVLTATGQPASVADVVAAAISGMRRSSGMSVPDPGLQGQGDLFGLGDGGPLQHLGDARRRLAAGHPLDRVVEVVEEAALDLIGQPAAVRRPQGALLGDEDVVGLLDAGSDGVPVDAGPVEPAQVDDLGVDVGLPDRLEHVVRHRQVGQDRHVRAGTADGGLAHRQ